MRKLTAIAVLTCTTLLAGCDASVNVETERAALLETDRAWAAASGASVPEILSFWASDAVVMPPDTPPLRGHQEIRAYIEESLNIPGFSVSWTPEGADVAASGDLGYTHGRNEFSFEGADGEIVRITGRYLTTWRKQADGSWKCTFEVWNNDPPARGP